MVVKVILQKISFIVPVFIVTDYLAGRTIYHSLSKYLLLYIFFWCSTNLMFSRYCNH